MGQMMGLMVTTKVNSTCFVLIVILRIFSGSPKHLQQRSSRIRRTPSRLCQNHQRLNPNLNRCPKHLEHQSQQDARSPDPRYARNRYHSGHLSTQFEPSLTPSRSDLADYLVRKGVPFRETHHISGQVVALAESKNVPMDHLSHLDLQSVDKRLESDFIFDYEKSVEMRTAKGGTVSRTERAYEDER